MKAADVKARVDCRLLAEHLGVRIARRGAAEWKAHCPNPGAHKNGDRNPSMTIGREGFRCWAASCGAKGDAFHLVELVRGLDFKAALAYLVEYTGGDTTPTRPAPEPLEAMEPEGIAPERVEVAERIWAAVAPLDLTLAATTWLTMRGIDPAVAHAAGCRDWSPALGRIQAILAPLSTEAKQAAGFYNREGKPWWPLAASIQGKPGAGGLCVPVYHPEHKAPLAWRWRLYNPRKLKTMAQPGGGVDALLGLHVGGGHKAPGQSPVLLVVEGEPDWLSALDAVKGKAAVLGLCAIARGWRDEWTAHLDGARWVVVMAHDDHGGGEKLAEGLYQSAVARFGWEWADKRLVRMLQPGNDDLNDKHRRDELQGYLEGMLLHLSKREA